jgi:hypothetical protein
MKLSGQTVTLLLTEDGKQVLVLASAGLPETSLMTVSVEESEDMGLWIRVPREDQMHFFLIRWEYILGIDLQSGMGRLIGMRG